MRLTRTLIPTLTLATLLAGQVLAGGLSTRRGSPTSRIVGQRSSTPRALRFRRPDSRRLPADPRFQRRSMGTRPRVGGTQGRGLVDRALGEAYGYDFRDGIALGIGRANRGRYDTARDRRVAENQGRRLGHYGTRIGNSLRRILSP